MKPRHADLFASDLDSDTLIRTIDRVLMFYIRTADRLQRTSTWLDNMEGGLAYLKQVVLEDSLDIAAELEREMQQVVDSYQCEWKTTLDNPQNRLLFRGFLNSDRPDEAVVMVPERGQIRPATPQEKPHPRQAHIADGEWVHIAALADIPANAGMAARLGNQQIALFHLPGNEPQVFALDNQEPGSQANVLARGLVGDANGEAMVVSPMYKKRFRLRDGQSLEDAALRVRVWPVKIQHGQIWVQRVAADQSAFTAIAEAS